MRNLVKISLLIMLTAGLSSCEKIKSIFDVDFDTTLSGNLDIDIQDALKSTNSYTFKKTATVNPLDDEDIAEYIDNIKEFAVNEVIVEVLYVSAGNVVFKKGTTFSVFDNNSKVTWTLGSDWDVTEGTQLTLEDVGDVYKAVVDILDKKGSFSVGAEGESSETGVFVTLKIGIDTKVTANPL
jgi:hypothetical protein